jgi:hypothetical protein
MNKIGKAKYSSRVDITEACGIMRFCVCRKKSMAYWMVGSELVIALIVGLAIYMATRK